MFVAHDLEANAARGVFVIVGGNFPRWGYIGWFILGFGFGCFGARRRRQGRVPAWLRRSLAAQAHVQVDDASAGTAPKTVEKILGRLNREARRSLFVQRAKALPARAVAAQLPAARLAVFQQRVSGDDRCAVVFVHRISLFSRRQFVVPPASVQPRGGVRNELAVVLAPGARTFEGGDGFQNLRQRRLQFLPRALRGALAYLPRVGFPEFSEGLFTIVAGNGIRMFGTYSERSPSPAAGCGRVCSFFFLFVISIVGLSGLSAPGLSFGLSGLTFGLSGLSFCPTGGTAKRRLPAREAAAWCNQ